MSFHEGSTIDETLLQLIKEKDGGYGIIYNGKAELVFQSGKYVGDLRSYEGKFSNSLFIKKSNIMKQFKEAIQRKLGGKKTVEFYGKRESECMSVYSQSSLKVDGEMAIPVRNRGKDVTLPLSSIDSLSPGTLEVMLESKGLRRDGAKKYFWKLVCIHAKVEDCPKNFMGYSAAAKFGNMYK